MNIPIIILIKQCSINGFLILPWNLGEKPVFTLKPTAVMRE